MLTKLITVTPEAEKLIAHMARVSNPNNQDNPEIDKLLAYCARNSHWSIFEMANMVVEINTSRAIAQQILRHRSFSFQEFSQRYAEVKNLETYEARSQDVKNRQNSNNDMTKEDKAWFQKAQSEVHTQAKDLYEQALSRGIAREQARFLLPVSASTKMYMNGTVRSWIHYLQLRCGNGTQQEHKDIANEIKKIFIEQFPITSQALEWEA